MPGRLEITVESQALQRALALGPDTLTRHLHRAIGRSLQEIARDWKLGAPKFRSEYANSILPGFESPLSGFVIAGSAHAAFVEYGTGPGGFPPLAEMEDWVRLEGITPRGEGVSSDDLPFLIARAIARRGTPAQPAARPAFDANRIAAERRIEGAVGTALREIEGGRP